MNGEDDVFRNRKWKITCRAGMAGTMLAAFGMLLVSVLMWTDDVPGQAGAETVASMLFTFVGFLTFIVGLYHGANVTQKALEMRGMVEMERAASGGNDASDQ